MITILITSISLLILYLLIKLFFKNYKKFDKLNSLVQSIIVIISLCIAVYTIEQSNEAAKESNQVSQITLKELRNITYSSNNVKNVLDSVAIKLGKLPVQLDTFSNSIKKLNNIVDEQQRKFVSNIIGLNSSVSNLSKSVNNYKDYIENYSEQLKIIVAQTDTQLVIWKDQQKILLTEFTKKPILKLIPNKFTKNDSTCIINELAIFNTGNTNADITIIFLIFWKVHLAKFEYKGAIVNNDEGNFISYQINLENENLNSNAGMKIPCNIILKKTEQSGFSYRIEYSSNHQDGRFVGDIRIKDLK